MATVEIPDEDISLVKSALGRAGALLEWEGKTHKNADKRERLTNEGAALISLAMQLTFFPFEQEDVTGTPLEIDAMEDTVSEEDNTVYDGQGNTIDNIVTAITSTPVRRDGFKWGDKFSDYLKDDVEESKTIETEDNDKWDGIRDHDNDH